jgi:hypothetical protein
MVTESPWKIHPEPIGEERVEPDGTVRDDGLWLPMSGPFLRKLILGLYTENRPYSIGRDDRVRAQSNRDFDGFLERVFAE